MILDYANTQLLEQPAPNLNEEDIAEIVNTGVSGTHFNNVPCINNHITSAVPSLEFIAEFAPHTLADIAKELKKGQPVAVWVVTSDGVNDYVHAVVITGMDDTKKEITYNGPAYGTTVTKEQSRFMSEWERLGTRMIKIEIGRITDRSMDEFMTRGTTE